MIERLKQLRNYLSGTLRYKLFYSRFKFLIRKHRREQIAFRIRVMDPECRKNGSCKICGCSVTALQMCSKPCPGEYYPPFMKKRDWLEFKYKDGAVLNYKGKYSFWKWEREGFSRHSRFYIFKDGKIILNRKIRKGEEIFD